MIFMNDKSNLPNVVQNSLYTDRQISLGDLQKILGKYGDNIQDIFELGPGQEWMFQARRNNKSAFFLQMLLRVEMELVPEQFQDKVNKVCECRGALRFAYVSRGLEKPYCVELKKQNAEIIFRDLSAVSEEELSEELDILCEADRRRGFDLENDPLLRITVFKLSRKNEYAFIISQPHINSDGISIGLLIKDIFVDYVRGVDHSAVTERVENYKKIAAYRDSIDINAELSYWKEYLKGATEEIRLPGMIDSKAEFDERVYIARFDEKIKHALVAAAKKYKVTMYNLLQTAWGIMLSRITGKSDILFGAVTSGREAEVYQSMMILGGFVRVLPVRMQLEDSMTFDIVVSKVQQDFTTSMKYSHCTLDQIQKAIGRKTPLFNHVLNCHNFTGSNTVSGGGIQIPGFKVLSGTVYDNLSEDLAIYFRQGTDDLELGIGYNGAVFSKETVEMYAETYKNVLNLICLHEEKIQIGQISGLDAAVFDYTAQMKQVEHLKKTMLLHKTTIFRCVEWDELMVATTEAELRTYLEEDIIFSADMHLGSLPIVISGYVELACKSIDGWLDPVKICKAGDVLSMAGIAKAPKPEITAIAKSKGVTILSVPCCEIYRLRAKYPEVNQEIVRILYRESMNYKKMWVNL